MNFWEVNKEALGVAIQYAEDKLTARQIASALTTRFGMHVTRAAVIGKLQRKKVPLQSGNKGGNPHNHPPKPHKPKRIKQTKSVALHVQNASGKHEYDGSKQGGCTIHQLNAYTCRWPLGGFHARPPYMYCGEMILFNADGKAMPYCREHFAASVDPDRMARYMVRLAKKRTHR